MRTLIFLYSLSILRFSCGNHPLFVNGRECPPDDPLCRHEDDPDDREPERTPTASPIEVQTGSPTKSPSASPTEPPTEPPTKPPTEPPTGAPSEPPSDSPSEPPTESPSDSPSKFPNEAPTESPSELPFASPSDSPSSSPNDAEPRPVCTPDAAGLFGEESPTIVGLTYYYEIEFEPSVVSSGVRDAVEEIEGLIGANILESLFDEACSQTRPSRTSRGDSNGTFRRKLESVGFNSRPRDSFVASCSDSDLDDICALIRGQATLYVSSQLQVNQEGSSAISAIEQSMEGDELIIEESGVISLTFINGTFSEVVATGRSGDNVDSGGGGDPVYIEYALVFFLAIPLAVIALVAAFLWRRKRRLRQNEMLEGHTDSVMDLQAEQQERSLDMQSMIEDTSFLFTRQEGVAS